MQIDSNGFIEATLTNYLEYMTADIQSEGTFGSDFTIKKEGVIDAILSTTSNAMISLEDKIAFAFKQINPYTAEGEWQDRLYAIIGLTRNYATNTVVTRTIEGTVGTVIDINELVFKTPQDDEFYLASTVTIGENGQAVGNFKAYQAGAIDCPIDSNLSIVSAPIGIVGVYYTEGNITNVGDNYEDDSEFRARWIATNSVKSGNTEGSMRVALLPLCDNSPKNLVIRQNRATQTYLDFPKHTMAIVLKSAESNTTIANTIFNNLTDGVGLYGSITETVKDISGEDVIISFSRAVNVPIYFNVEIILKEGYSLVQVNSDIKKAIVNNFNYGMGERVVANDFYQYINNIEGVDYVTTLQVKTGESGATYGSTIVIDYDEYGTVDIENVNVSEA